MEARAKSKKPRAAVRRIVVHDRRITIPKDLRDFLGIRDGSVLEISAEDGRLIFQVITR